MGFPNKQEDEQSSRPFLLGYRIQPNDSTKEGFESIIRADIVIDSGASEHIVCELSLLSDIHKVLAISVELVNGTKVSCTQRGKIYVDVGRKLIIIGSIHYTPGTNLSILSCFKLDERGVTTTIKEAQEYIDGQKRQCVISKNS